MHHLTDQHLDQWAMVPWCRPDKLLQDQALDIDQGRNPLSVFAVQMRQEPFEVEVHVALAGLGLKSMLVRHYEVAQTVHHVVKHIGENDAITNQFRLPLCPRWCHLFASTK
jgi:hypothetical protein